MAQGHLLERLARFQIGSESDGFSFSARLSRDNVWSEDYSKRCIEEYKKFIYLAVVSDRPVTPSDQIDQVWHLHLTYTKSYWLELCGTILGRPLHHEPTKGGNAESTKFRSQYQDTLDKYLEIFGTQPPRDIWPIAEDRFAEADEFVRLNKARYWLMKKPSKRTLLVTASPLVLASCVQNGSDLDFWFFVKTAIGVYAVYKIFQWLANIGGGRGGGGTGGCSSAGCSGCGG